MRSPLVFKGFSLICRYLSNTGHLPTVLTPKSRNCEIAFNDKWWSGTYSLFNSVFVWLISGGNILTIMFPHYGWLWVALHLTTEDERAPVDYKLFRWIFQKGGGYCVCTVHM